MDANWWNTALQSYDVGREHRADRENAQAFQVGGYGAVEQAAGNRGDMQTAMTTRRFQDQQHEQAFQWFEQNAPYARNVLRRARAIQDPQQRGAFLNSQRQRFEGLGFRPDQIDGAIAALTNPETAEEAFTSYDAAFTQHEDPNWQLATVPTQDGQGVEQRPIAIDPSNGAIQRGEGSLPVVPGDVQSFGSGGLYRQNRNNPQGYEIVREPRSVAADYGTEGYSIVSPGEVEALGLPPGSYQRNNATGQVTVLGRQRGQYTDAAASSAQFASRMAAADQTLIGLEDSQTNPQGVFVAATGMGNQSERQVRQAQREFVNAILRRESGAVISPSEFASASQQYFPQPGDGAEVIAQKRAARQRALMGLVNASQGAYEEWYGEGSGAEAAPQAPAVPQGSTMGAIVGARGAPRDVLERPNEIPAGEWAAMTPAERNRVIQILGRQQ